MTKTELQREIKNILKNVNIDLSKNASAKEGLEKAQEILSYNQRNLAGIDKLGSVQARAIAMFAVAFNNRKVSGEFFVKLGEVITGKRKKDEINGSF